MITWSKDKYLDEICVDINKYISNYGTKEYYIFGMKQENRPHVKLTPTSSKVLKDLFDRSGYSIEFYQKNEKYCSSCGEIHTRNNCHCRGVCSFCDQRPINIGLRLDVRLNKVVARKLIKTIIFAMENKLIIDKSSRLNLGSRVKS